jgi:hypothetical protein
MFANCAGPPIDEWCNTLDLKALAGMSYPSLGRAGVPSRPWTAFAHGGPPTGRLDHRARRGPS